MIVFLDTNVILDILMKREPFFTDSFDAFKTCVRKSYDLYLPANAVTDIYYLLRKALGKRDSELQSLDTLLHLVKIADTRANDIKRAFDSDLPDFEDAVLVEVAKRYAADVILTRNVKDFKHSPVPVKSPSAFLKR